MNNIIQTTAKIINVDIIKDFSDGEVLEIALVENLLRENLSAIEEAEAYQKLMDEFSHTQEKVATIVGTLLTIAIVITTVLTTVVIPNNKYNKAMELKEDKRYEEAIEMFVELGDYKDSIAQLNSSRYDYALVLIDEDKIGGMGYSQGASGIINTHMSFGDLSKKIKSMIPLCPLAIGKAIGAGQLNTDLLQKRISI